MYSNGVFYKNTATNTDKSYLLVSLWFLLSVAGDVLALFFSLTKIKMGDYILKFSDKCAVTSEARKYLDNNINLVRHTVGEYMNNSSWLACCSIITNDVSLLIMII